MSDRKVIAIATIIFGVAVVGTIAFMAPLLLLLFISFINYGKLCLDTIATYGVHYVELIYSSINIDIFVGRA